MRRSHSQLLHIALSAFLATLAVGGAAKAATSCTINATGAVAFGPYDWNNPSPTDSVGTITYTCDGQAAVILSQGSSGSYTARTMTSGANTLQYNLYSDAARTVVWGTFFTSGFLPPVAPAGTNTRLQVYGRMPAGQNVPPGSYTDTITITFVF